MQQANDPINNYLDSLKGKITTNIPNLQACEHHMGDIDEREFNRRQQRTPAVHIALGSIGQLSNRPDGATNWPLTVVCYVFARDERMDSPQVAVRLVQQVIATLRNHRFNAASIASTEPHHVSARNLRGDTQSNVSLWAVRCELELIVGPAIYPGTGPVVTELDVERIDD